MRSKARAKPKLKQRPKTSFKIEGQASLMEFARHKPEAILSIFASPEATPALRSELQKTAVDLAIQPLPKAPQIAGGGKDLGRVSPVRAEVKVVMQGEADLFQWTTDAKPRLVLALDHITDPRNLGAIVRSAAFFGIEKVIVPERRQVLLTDASVATSQGGFARCDLVCVVNLGRVLEQLKTQGYWVLGAAMKGEPLEDLKGVYDHQILVLGAEDTGLSQGITQKCDRLIALQGPGGSPGGLDSLNVAVAAGILMHGLMR